MVALGFHQGRGSNFGIRGTPPSHSQPWLTRLSSETNCLDRKKRQTTDHKENVKQCQTCLRLWIVHWHTLTLTDTVQIHFVKLHGVAHLVECQTQDSMTRGSNLTRSTITICERFAESKMCPTPHVYPPYIHA